MVDTHRPRGFGKHPEQYLLKESVRARVAYHDLVPARNRLAEMRYQGRSLEVICCRAGVSHPQPLETIVSLVAVASVGP